MGGHYQVVNTLYDGRAATVLYSGHRQAAQSGVAKDGKPDLLFDYNQRMYELATSVIPKSVLIIGGGVGTLATALLAVLPNVHIDIVEPDDGLAALGRRYFGLPDDERLRIFNTDGRTFLREHAERYDLLLVDAFVHTSIPQSLSTLEAFEAYGKHLQANGLFAMNVISRYHGAGSHILARLYAATLHVFNASDIFLASRGYSLWLPQNFVLTAQNNKFPLESYMRYERIAPPDINPANVLRDADIPNL